MTIWILFHETNVGHTEESDGYVEAVYATEEQATAAQLAAVRAALAEGYRVYWNPDTEEEDEDWDHDWRVEAHTVRADAELPKGGFFAFLPGVCPTCGGEPLPDGPHVPTTTCGTCAGTGKA